MDDPWLDEHIRKKGPLGAQHPRTKFIMEGDTPSFLFLVQNGLGNPEHPDNKATIWRWRTAYQNDFRARMDWTVASTYAKANHPPAVKLGHASELTAKLGDRVDLNAEGSRDPDGHTLSYQWFHYPEPGTYTLSAGVTGAPLKIEDADKAKAWFAVPTAKFGRLGTLHIILAVTDSGTPALTRYKRVLVTVLPNSEPNKAR